MWLAERRAAAQREKQLTQAHERIIQERASLDALLTAIRENTRVLAQMESGQRTLISVFAAPRARTARDASPRRGAGV